jgi:hypothetical protein
MNQQFSAGSAVLRQGMRESLTGVQEFTQMTISGKIRRIELRELEAHRRAASGRQANEYWEEDFPELKSKATESSQ